MTPKTYREQRSQKAARLLALFALAATGCSGATEGNEAITQGGPPGPGYIQLPGGVAMHASCVRELAEGEVMEDDGVYRMDGSLKESLPACAYPRQDTMAQPEVPALGVPAPFKNGWIENAHWTSSGSAGSHAVQNLSATFDVPKSPPTYDGQLIYLFPGLENIPTTYIAQPVLQFGNNGIFGGGNWTIAAWMVSKQGGHSAARTVAAGDTIGGYINYLGSCNAKGCLWQVGVKNVRADLTYLTFTYRTSHRPTFLLGGVLEIYRVSSCSQLPGSSINFVNIWARNFLGQRIYPTFDGIVGSSNCQYGVATSPISVELFY
jgi:hypothetical protein